MTKKKWMQLRRFTLCLTAAVLIASVHDLASHAIGENGIKHDSINAMVFLASGWFVWSVLPTPPWQR